MLDSVEDLQRTMQMHKEDAAKLQHFRLTFYGNGPKRRKTVRATVDVRTFAEEIGVGSNVLSSWHIFGSRKVE